MWSSVVVLWYVLLALFFLHFLPCSGVVRPITGAPFLTTSSVFSAQEFRELEVTIILVGVKIYMFWLPRFVMCVWTAGHLLGVDLSFAIVIAVAVSTCGMGM